MLKPSFIILLVASAAIFSCSKEAAPGGYFMSMKIDGKSYSLSDSVGANKNAGITIIASSRLGGKIYIQINDSLPGTYPDAWDYTTKEIQYFAVTAYITSNNNVVAANQFMAPGPGATNGAISLTVTKVTDQFLEGTFSGKIVDLIGAGMSTVTDGSFRAPFR